MSHLWVWQHFSKNAAGTHVVCKVCLSVPWHKVVAHPLSAVVCGTKEGVCWHIEVQQEYVGNDFAFERQA